MKARKAMALAMTAAMVGGLMTVPVMAEENLVAEATLFIALHLLHPIRSSTQNR